MSLFMVWTPIARLACLLSNVLPEMHVFAAAFYRALTGH
jgi:hypothetical protein